MSQLSLLIRTALLGTQREPLPEPPAGTLLADLLASVNSAEPEAILLSLAGAAQIMEMAGQLPYRIFTQSTNHLPPTDDVPACGAASASRLGAMLDGRFQTMVPAFLEEVAHAGRRIPDEMLPALLQHGVKAVSLRSLIIPAIGRTGRWLASQNPAWAYAAFEADTWEGLARLWRSGSSEQRGALLIQVRATHPEWGVPLAQITWKSEPANVRSRYIRALEQGLGAADEPFLEVALDDRDNTTRRKASDLLAQIPESRLMQRMSARADDLLRWTPDEHSPVEITLPDPLPADILRDCALPAAVKTAPSSMRGMRLSAILGSVPLTHWEAAWGVSPEEIVRAALASNLPRSLIRGFVSAAVRQHNSIWAGVLLRSDQYSPDVIRLAALLPAPDFEVLIAEADHPGAVLDGGVMVRLLHYWTGQWSVEVARRWIHALEHHLTQPQDKPPGMTLRMVFKKFGRACPVSLADEVAAALLPLIQPDSVWWGMVQEAVAIIRFRRAMLADLESQPGLR